MVIQDTLRGYYHSLDAGTLLFCASIYTLAILEQDLSGFGMSLSFHVPACANILCFIFLSVFGHGF